MEKNHHEQDGDKDNGGIFATVVVKLLNTSHCKIAHTA